MTREEIINSPSFCVSKIQLELFRKVNTYMEENGMNRTEFAKKLGVSKSYVTQLLNGQFDFRLSKFVELAIAIGFRPTITYTPVPVSVSKRYEHSEDNCSVSPQLNIIGSIDIQAKTKFVETTNTFTGEVEISDPNNHNIAA